MSVWEAAGCEFRGCDLTVSERLDAPVIEVWHSGKNPEAYRRFDRFVLRESPRNAIVRWIESVHEYEDQRDAAS